MGIVDFLSGYYITCYNTISFLSWCFLIVSYSSISSLGCLPALLSAIVGWAAMGGGLRGILAMGGSLWGILTRLTRVSKWSPEADPCLSSMSVKVKVCCITSFPQLVKHVYEGV